MKTLKTLLIPCLLLLTTSAAMAQSQAKSQPAAVPTANHHTTAPPQFFRLTFVLKELNGKKVIDSRSYKTEISAEPFTNRSRHNSIYYTRRSIRAGSHTHYKYGGHYVPIEVGVNIDCLNPSLIGGKLTMHVNATISNLVNTGNSGQAAVQPPPIIQNNTWGSEVLIPIGKPSILFSSQDPASTRTMELDLTATPLH